MVPLNVSIATFGQIIGQSSLTFPVTKILALTPSLSMHLPPFNALCRTCPPNHVLFTAPAATRSRTTDGSTRTPAGTFIYKSDEAPGFPTGHYTNAGFMFFGAFFGVVLRCVYVRRNRALGAGEPRWRL